jgi:hypothetical protein
MRRVGMFRLVGTVQSSPGFDVVDERGDVIGSDRPNLALDLEAQ